MLTPKDLIPNNEKVYKEIEARIDKAIKQQYDTNRTLRKFRMDSYEFEQSFYKSDIEFVLNKYRLVGWTVTYNPSTTQYNELCAGSIIMSME